VLLRPAGEGTGIVAGAPIKAILESAGIRNILTKTVGSDNPLSVVKATFDALKNLPAASNTAAGALSETIFQRLPSAAPAKWICAARTDAPSSFRR
jgi:ribosomal protein S5